MLILFYELEGPCHVVVDVTKCSTLAHSLNCAYLWGRTYIASFLKDHVRANFLVRFYFQGNVAWIFLIGDY